MFIGSLNYEFYNNFINSIFMLIYYWYSSVLSWTKSQKVERVYYNNKYNGVRNCYTWILMDYITNVVQRVRWTIMKIKKDNGDNCKLSYEKLLISKTENKYMQKRIKKTSAFYLYLPLNLLYH